MPDKQYIVNALGQLEAALESVEKLLDSWKELESLNRDQLVSLELELEQAIETLEFINETSAA